MHSGPNYSAGVKQNVVVDYTNTPTPTKALNLRWGVLHENNPPGILGESAYFNEHDVGSQNALLMPIRRAPSIRTQPFTDVGLPSLRAG